MMVARTFQLDVAEEKLLAEKRIRQFAGLFSLTNQNALLGDDIWLQVVARCMRSICRAQRRN